MPSTTAPEALSAFLAQVLTETRQRFFFFQPRTHDYFCVPTYFDETRIPEAVERCLEMSSRGAEVFLEARDHSRNFVAARLWEPRDLVELAFFPLRPSVVLTEDAAGTHCAVWFLVDSVSSGGDRLDEALARVLCGKRKVLRYVPLPGSANYGGEPPFEVRVAEFPAERYSLGAVEDALRVAGAWD